MSFLNPTLALFGCLAVAVPIIIHLLNRRKFERVTWAAMRFLQDSVEQNQRRMQIEDILLLILRCLVVLLLGLALARPTTGCSAAHALGNQGVTAVLILDNSYSMSATDGVRSRFEQAKLAAEEVIASMPAGSSAAVMLASDGAPDQLIPEPTLDLVKVRRVVTDAKLTSRGSDLYPAVQKAVDTLKGRSGLRKEVYVFTDGQLVAWKQFDRIHKLLEQERRDLTAGVILVGSSEDANVAVTGLRMASGLAAVERELRFEAEVRNFGGKPVENVRVTLRVDGQEPSDGQTILSLPAGGSQTVSLHAKLRDEGYHTVTAAVPADHLPADDTRTMAIRAIQQAKVLLVDGSLSGGGLSRDDETFYLRHALVPVPPSEAEQYFVKLTTVGPPELDSTRFEGYDAVVLANVADFSQRTADLLAEYVRRGGGLILFPGDATSPSFYNDTLSKKYHLLPATFGPTVGDPRRDTQFFTLQAKQFSHPIASIWSDAASGSPAAARFYKAYELTPADDAAKEGQKPADRYAAEAGPPRVVLSFGQGFGGLDQLVGKPAVIERPFGLGRVIQFASTASSRWTSLPVAAGGGVFLPLMDRVVASIVQRQDETLNVPAGGTFVFHPPDEAIGKEALFFKPGQTGEATDSRQIELPAATGLPTVTYDQTDLAGAYAMQLPAGGQVKFAVQEDADNNESSLDELSPTQEKDLGKTCTVTHWSPGQSLGHEIEQTRNGTELWGVLAWMVLVLAAAEMCLAMWFSRTK